MRWPLSLVAAGVRGKPFHLGLRSELSTVDSNDDVRWKIKCAQGMGFTPSNEYSTFDCY